MTESKSDVYELKNLILKEIYHLQHPFSKVTPSSELKKHQKNFNLNKLYLPKMYCQHVDMCESQGQKLLLNVHDLTYCKCPFMEIWFYSVAVITPAGGARFETKRGHILNGACRGSLCGLQKLTLSVINKRLQFFKISRPLVFCTPCTCFPNMEKQNHQNVFTVKKKNFLYLNTNIKSYFFLPMSHEVSICNFQ